MRNFKGHKTLEQIREQCEAAGGVHFNSDDDRDGVPWFEALRDWFWIRDEAAP